MATALPDADRDLDADVVTRLADADLPREVEDLILAALDGDETLADALGGNAPDRPELHAPDAAAAEPVGAYISRIRVAAFRGIGPAAELRLKPGSGLTVVTGRNGSGKSSFAEAAEIALTGDTKRWAGRTQVWRQGWRNLHAADIPTRVDVDLVIDGRPGSTTIGRRWPAGGDLGDAQPGSVTCDDLGWTEAVGTYRPFLSYAELGAVVDGKPSEMYDAVQRVLGLDRLVDAQARLNAAHRERRDIARRANAARAEVRALVDGHPDPRAAEAGTIFAQSTPNLEALDRLIQGLDDTSDGSGHAREILALAVPDAATVLEAIEAWTRAAARVGGLAGTSAERARSLATLLSQALACTPEDAHECGHAAPRRAAHARRDGGGGGPPGAGHGEEGPRRADAAATPGTHLSRRRNSRRQSSQVCGLGPVRTGACLRSLGENRGPRPNARSSMIQCVRGASYRRGEERGGHDHHRPDAPRGHE